MFPPCAREKDGKRIALPFCTVARKRRVAPGGFVYHVCNRGSRRGVIAETYEEYCDVLALIERARAKIGMRIIAYNVLDTHFHLVLWPVSDSDLSRFMQAFEQTHAQRFHRRRGTRGCGAVYQSRFVHRMIRDERGYFGILRYVEANARRHGAIENAEDWPWSSAWCGEPIGPTVTLHDGPLSRPEHWLEILNDI
jgi:putative transposase